MSQLLLVNSVYRKNFGNCFCSNLSHSLFALPVSFSRSNSKSPKVWMFYMIFMFNYSGLLKRSNESTRLIVTTILGVVFGFLVGISFPNVSVTKVSINLVNICLFICLFYVSLQMLSACLWFIEFCLI